MFDDIHIVPQNFSLVKSGNSAIRLEHQSIRTVQELLGHKDVHTTVLAARLTGLKSKALPGGPPRQRLCSEKCNAIINRA